MKEYLGYDIKTIFSIIKVSDVIKQEIESTGKYNLLGEQAQQFLHKAYIELEKKSESGPIKTYEYLIHHIEIDDSGKETIHHCMLYDHIANMFTQGHLVVSDGTVTLDGKAISEGTFHVITGLDESQDVCWSDDEAMENGITPKRMIEGMTAKQKAKEW